MKNLLIALLLLPLSTISQTLTPEETGEISSANENAEKLLMSTLQLIIKKIPDNTESLEDAKSMLDKLNKNQSLWSEMAYGYCSFNNQGSIYREIFPICMTNQIKKRITELQATNCNIEDVGSSCIIFAD